MKKKATCKSFRHLKRLLRENDLPVENFPAVRIPDSGGKVLTPQQEKALFLKAVEGVIPLKSVNAVAMPPRRLQTRHLPNEDDNSLICLEDLIENGRGFHVAYTPEYIEGKGHDVPHEMARRLHQGQFAIQAHIDLHGMTVRQAREAVDKFFHQAVRQGLRMVLIVHGRGLSSPVEPVLKSHLVKWLHQGSWRKWVMAYTSARICDGGAGATYILLRSRPLPKRLRNPHRI